jgi:hypothetical protein
MKRLTSVSFAHNWYVCFYRLFDLFLIPFADNAISVSVTGVLLGLLDWKWQTCCSLLAG